MNSIQIEVQTCNNIDTAAMTLVEHKLNIKFAPNGTGKSTIARAMLLSKSPNENELLELMPFKLKKDNPENKRPKVIGAEKLNNIMCFNEGYVEQFIYKPNELLHNSFDILIRTESYKQNEREIEELVRNIKQLFTGNSELDELIKNLKEMGDAFKLSKSGLSKSSTGMKALSSGNKIEHVPAGLEPYTPFIQGVNGVGWIDWQTKGYEFIELSENCPFCASQTADKKNQIKKVGHEYDKNTIKNLISIIGMLDKLGDYFSIEAKTKLEVITHLKSGIERQHEEFLAAVKKQIDSFTEKLERLKTLSAFQFQNGEKVVDYLPSFKLDLQFFSDLKSLKMESAIAPINNSINMLTEQAGRLQGKINQQLREIRNTIEMHQKCINEFLEYAGYRYAVEIAGEGDKAQLKLKHIDYDEHLSGGNQHLSFGERNAFAIVLFMYECLSKKPDLIILDDPISSFDKNKKYAILEMLFRRDARESFKGKTVLMLTHDVEPIIDTIRVFEKKFSNQTSAAFLKFTSGNIRETTIGKDDIQTFSKICKRAIASEKHQVIKLIYLRRHYEIDDDKSDAYQVLSNLLHGRSREISKDTREPKEADGEFPKMSSDIYENGCKEILDRIATFSYSVTLSQITDTAFMRSIYDSCTTGYEKLQIFRLLGIDVKNSVVKKFIDESYHVENEFICQLDPSKFDTTPQYVIDECDKILAQGCQ